MNIVRRKVEGQHVGEDPYKFSMVLQKHRKLMAVSDPSCTLKENKPQKWTKEQFIEIMKMLVETNNYGRLSKSLCEKFRKLRYRLYDQVQFDSHEAHFLTFYDVPKYHEAIITAESPASLALMKVL